MLQLAKEMQCLEAFVHISTAFSNCPLDHIGERFYPEILTCPAAKVLEFNESLSTEVVDSIAPALLGKFPNTYTYTKALAEQVIQLEAKDVPICIFRPAISKLLYMYICKILFKGYRIWFSNPFSSKNKG